MRLKKPRYLGMSYKWNVFGLDNISTNNNIVREKINNSETKRILLKC